MKTFQPYDLSTSFTLVPNREKYQLTFWQNHSVNFKSKRDAFTFISAVSNFFAEVLQFCEMYHNSISCYRYQIAPKSKSLKDKYNIFTNNEYQIIILLRDLKFYQFDNVELYRIVRKFELLLEYLIENTNILHDKLQSAITHNVILIRKIADTFNHVLSNVESNYSHQKLTIFNI